MEESNISGLSDDLPIWIGYSDTDQMKVVYYAEYFKYFENGRASLLRKLNIPYSFFEQVLGVFLPVYEAFAKYHKSAKFEDLIIVKTTIKEITSKTIHFNSKIFRDDLLLVSGYTKHIFVNSKGKIVQCPDELLIAIDQFL